MYFFGKLSWVAAFFVFLATWQSVGEVVALALAAGAWLIVWQVSKSIVQADRERTARNKFEKQVAKDIAKFGTKAPAPTYQPEPVPQISGLPEWSSQLTPNRREWLKEKIAEGVAQGDDRSAIERRLMLEFVERGWIS